jgi:transposase InsO family protein
MFIILFLLFVAVAASLVRLARSFVWSRSARGYRRIQGPARMFFRSRAKPAWVRREIIRMSALMPNAGCRRIAGSFNRRFAAKRRMTVGKSFVAEVIRRHRYDIGVARRRIKNARPRRVPKNLIWGIDLTGKAALDGKTHAVLAILEHASRAALWLEALEQKSTWTLVQRIVEAIRRYGKPDAVRTDNEPVFTSRVFGLALFVLGIRHQRIDPHCPWQNGRVERFFGTLKEKLDQLAVQSVPVLNALLVEFRFYYNHVRTHQNLGGSTPAEAWAGLDPLAQRFSKEYWFETWDGLLTGYYLRR